MNDVKLKTKHIIMLSKIVTKMNINLEGTEKDTIKSGSDIILDIVKNIQYAESELYELIGSIVAVEPAQVAEMEIDDLIEVLKVVVNKITNFIHKGQSSTT